jgi:hypothetical protein
VHEQQVQGVLKRYVAYSFESRSDAKEPSQKNAPSPNELISSLQSVPQPLSFSSADHFADPSEDTTHGLYNEINSSKEMRTKPPEISHRSEGQEEH